MSVELRKEKVVVEHNNKTYEFTVRELTMKDYQEVLRAGFGNQGKIRTIVGEPPVIDFDLISYSYELVKRAVESFGEFGSIENLPSPVYGKLVEVVLLLNPFPTLFT